MRSGDLWLAWVVFCLEPVPDAQCPVPIPSVHHLAVRDDVGEWWQTELEGEGSGVFVGEDDQVGAEAFFDSASVIEAQQAGGVVGGGDDGLGG